MMNRKITMIIKIEVLITIQSNEDDKNDIDNYNDNAK